MRAVRTNAGGSQRRRAKSMTAFGPGRSLRRYAPAVGLPAGLAHRCNVGVSAEHIKAIEHESAALGGER